MLQWLRTVPLGILAVLDVILVVVTIAVIVWGIQMVAPTPRVPGSVVETTIRTPVPGVLPAAETPRPAQAQPQAGAGFSSGGLGMSVAEWERAHGPADKAGTEMVRTYEQQRLTVIVVNEKITSVTRNLGNQAVPLDAARTEAKKLLPADAQFVRTLTATSGPPVDLYQSATLRTQLRPELWNGSELGSIIIFYEGANTSIVGFIVALGDKPS